MVENRKHARHRVPREDLQITFWDRPGEPRVVTAALIDVSKDGVGVEIDTAILDGTVVAVAGLMHDGNETTPVQARARVAHCLDLPGGGFKVGLSFEDAGARNPFYRGEQQARVETLTAESLDDHYEVLQLSPNADLDMIHRTYRLLAQRYHPDNRETGNEEAFKQLQKAYRVLQDPERRAAYDVHYNSLRKRRWKIFDQPEAAQGSEGEKRKRAGILSLLYTQRIHQPEHPTVNIKELEDLLGIPREHLEFGLWYLRENAWITRSDNGRYAITAKGVDAAEATGMWQPPKRPMLTTSGAQAEPPDGGNAELRKDSRMN